MRPRKERAGAGRAGYGGRKTRKEGKQGGEISDFGRSQDSKTLYKPIFILLNPIYLFWSRGVDFGPPQKRSL